MGTDRMDDMTGLERRKAAAESLPPVDGNQVEQAEVELSDDATLQLAKALRALPREQRLALAQALVAAR